MASNSTKTYRTVDDVLRDVLDSEFEVAESDSEDGELSSEEEELIDNGIDAELDIGQPRCLS